MSRRSCTAVFVGLALVGSASRAGAAPLDDPPTEDAEPTTAAAAEPEEEPAAAPPAPPPAPVEPPASEPARSPVEPPASEPARSPVEAAAPAEETGFGVAPFAAAAYQDETSLLFGAAAVGFYRHPRAAGRRDSQMLLAAAVTLREQFTGVLAPDLYLASDQVHFAAMISAAKFPDRFFGIESGERVAEPERYTPVYTEVEVSPQLRLLQSEYLYLGPDVRYQYANVLQRSAGGLLDRRVVTGADGGQTFQVGARGFWDTRDSTLYPHRGHLLEVVWLGGHDALGSDFSFTRTRFDGRLYVPGPFAGHVLALQAVFELRTGEAPFYDLGSIGGGRLLRGHFKGKHRDAQLGAAQVEYRLPVVWRFGVVAFAGVGTVTPSFRALPDAKPYAAAGGGIRFAPSKKAPVNIRLDVAYGDEPRFYLDVGEAF